MIAQGFTPHDKQRDIIDSVLHSDAKFHVVSVGRQMGKSLMGLNLLLYWAINDKPCKILWVSPVYSQITKVQKELVSAVESSGLIKSSNFTDNYIRFKFGSEIYFRSAERYDNIRGYTFDYAILDEAAFMKNEAWTTAIRPTLAVKGKKVLFLSTPKGKNWFYDLFKLGESSDHQNYMSYRGSSYDTPFISEEEILDAKRTLPPAVFKQEYLAEFLDSGGEVFTNLDSHTFSSYPALQGKCYAGLDLGKQDDYTVLTFMDERGNVIGVWRDNQRSWNDLITEITKRVKEKNAILTMEVNSIGDVIYDSLKKSWRDTHAFVTTNKSKQEIIEGLILDFNENTVRIPDKTLFPHLYEELGYFTFDYSPSSRTIKYGHPPGLHDDCVISLALANYCRKTQKSKGNYSYVHSGY